jgi:hypothetical protein
MKEDQIQNNSAYHREWLFKVQSDSGKKEGVTTGFEYAIQPDGTCFAERRWEELRKLGGYRFVTMQDQPNSRLYQTSLDRVENSLLESRRRYTQQQALPSRPEPTFPNETSPSDMVVLSTMNEPEHASGAAFLSPTRRIRNRHNAVYGQHRPNAINSPACAAKVFGEEASKKEEQTRLQTLLEGTMDSSGTGTYDTSIGPAYVRNSNRESSMFPPDPVETDDVDDSLFIDLDVDQLVAERQQESSRLSQSTETPFEYGHDWENNSS